ncbi:modification methylase [Salmonella enterica]|nr:modification methylase [Salmonella enterica subsp. enterica serovar Saintpaul]EEC1303357.1 modification methylase [Salmonella enterica]
MNNDNKNLHSAKREKNDEFYTMFDDVEKELMHYRDQFKGKTIFLNCDDYTSSFWKFFQLNFKFFGLKKLVATHYVASGAAYKREMFSAMDIHETKLKGNGDFRSDESKEILSEVDMVITNPPFSLFREFVSQLMEFGKKFIILGSHNAITYKEVFPLIRDDKMWLGAKHQNEYAFTLPDGSIQKLRNIVWYTNMENSRRNESITLYREFEEAQYAKYDNYDAIEVGRYTDIPLDYKGVMGVPITFLNRYNPAQFKIIGATESEGKGFSAGLWDAGSRIAQATIGGKKVYKRIFIQAK